MNQSLEAKASKPAVALDAVWSLLIFGAGLLGERELRNFSVYLIYGTVLFLGILAADFALAKRAGRGRGELVLTGLFLFGYLGALAAASPGLIRLFIALITASVFFAYHSRPPQGLPRKSVFEVVNIITAVYLLTFLWALNFFFAAGWWLTLLLVFGFFTLLFWQAFNKLRVPRSDVWPACVLSALIMTEIAWAAIYLPVNFITGAVAVFSPFYLIFMLSSSQARKRLSRDKVYFHVGIMLVVLFLSLVSSPWTY